VKWYQTELMFYIMLDKMIDHFTDPKESLSTVVAIHSMVHYS